MFSPVKIAAIQIEPYFHEVDRNLEKAKKYILEACENGAEIIVLPEVFNVGSAGKCRRDVYRVAEEVPGGKTCDMLLSLAKEKGVYIAGSMVEKEGMDLYNTAVLVGPDGIVGKYRKTHLCSNEFLWYEPGNLGIPVFHTPFGRIALLICMDTYFPETFRIAALQGADLVIVPYASGDYGKAYGMPEEIHTPLTVLCMAASVSNHFYVVGCNRVGTCNGLHAGGQTIITNPNGGISAPIAPWDEETIVYAEVDLVESRRRNTNPTNNRLTCRRTDLYSADLGYSPISEKK